MRYLSMSRVNHEEALENSSELWLPLVGDAIVDEVRSRVVLASLRKRRCIMAARSAYPKSQRDFAFRVELVMDICRMPKNLI